MSLVMRNLTIAIKYAYMTRSWWKALEQEHTAEELATPLMISWYSPSPETAALQAPSSPCSGLASSGPSWTYNFSAGPRPWMRSMTTGG
eukprot:2990804-Heterocapsa_arctica.AAC.1